MKSIDFSALVSRHRNYFRTGATRSAEWRESQLIALRAMMTDHAEDFFASLWTDLRRNRTDADLIDVGYINGEVDHALSHLRKWMKPAPVSTPPMFAPSDAHVQFDPLGVGLIIGTWNYPVMLTLSPLIAAISGGNTAVIKPSELAPATADVIARFVPEYLDRDAFSVVLGGVPETTALLQQRWDHIFFTGGPTVAKVIMNAAATHLTPVVLELGGKSPTIVHSSADLQSGGSPHRAGTLGQCRPDLHCAGLCARVQGCRSTVSRTPQRNHRSVLRRGSSEKPGLWPDHHYRVTSIGWRPCSRAGRSTTAVRVDRADRFIAPTILVNVSPESPVMQDEIFGPILPILEIESVHQVVDFVNARPSPLGLYVFAEDQEVTKHILDATTSGDAAVNDCTLHPLIHDLPFGGVGNSGMGKYHGEWGFRAYTNARGVLNHSTQVDLDVRYPPYSRNELPRESAERPVVAAAARTSLCPA